MHARPILALGIAVLTLAGCARGTQFDETGGVRITRSACPAVAIPVHTGDVTIFSPPQSRDASAIDVVANLTDLRGGCVESGEQLATTATFAIQARRQNGAGARDVVLPYFATVMRGGTQIVSKQIGQIALHFNDGELRASTTGTASANISRAAATLPADVLDKVTRRRRPGDADASIDPMSDPAVRAAVSQASFELLIGFQLTQEQLEYNATR